MVVIQTNFGEIKLELDVTNTPKTAENFLSYVKEGFYDGTLFHRVINGFMIQGGGFNPGLVQKKAREPIENEADKAKPNKRGSVAMARTSDPHSASSQFFINVIDNNFLNFTDKTNDGWGYCVFGQVIEGMDIVDKIRKVATETQQGHADVPQEDVVITKMFVDEA